MIREATMNASEQVALSASPVPLAALRATLRGFPGVFTDQLNPHFLTTPFKPCSNGSVEPVGQPSVQHARKLSPCTVSNSFQIFYDKGFDSFEVEGPQSIENDVLGFSVSVLLPLGKRLDFGVGLPTDEFTTRSSDTSFVVAVYSNHFTGLFQLRAWFFQYQVHEDSAFADTHTDRIADLPTVGQFAVYMFRGLQWDHYFGCAGTSKLHGIIERAGKLFDGNKPAVESDSRIMKVRTGLTFGGTNGLLGLFGKGLCQAGSDAKPFRSAMNSRGIGQYRRKVPALPKEVDVILGYVSAAVKKNSQRINLAGIEPWEKHAGRAAHGRLTKLSMSFKHGIYDKPQREIRQALIRQKTSSQERT